MWLLPLANRSDTASQRWQDFTAPYTERLAPFARLFVSLNAKKPIEIHNLKDALALQGNIKLSGKDAVEINVKLTPQMAAFLRAQSFDEYTSNGWKVNVDGDVRLPPAHRRTGAARPTAGAAPGSDDPRHGRGRQQRRAVQPRPAAEGERCSRGALGGDAAT